jgi:hypothetical protein
MHRDVEIHRARQADVRITGLRVQQPYPRLRPCGRLLCHKGQVEGAAARRGHAFFGLQTVPIPPAAAEQAGLPEGLYVQAVTPGGPAATAGRRG